MSQNQQQERVDIEGAIEDSMSETKQPRGTETLLSRPSARSLTVNLGPHGQGGVVEATHPDIDFARNQYRERGGCPDSTCDGTLVAPLYERTSPQGGLVAQLPGRQTPMATEADYIVGAGKCDCCGGQSGLDE